MRINKFGIWYIHARNHPVHSDEVCWIWPWRRKLSDGKDKKWISIGFNSTFKSLKELNETWDGYVEACKKCFKESMEGEINERL